jgi:hypothetical protein
MEPKQPNKLLTIEQGQALINYLITKPWVEVNPLIEILRSLPDEPAKAENKTK